MGAEAYARWGLGLGTPPLFIRDSTIEYRLKPNQRVQRFGNDIRVNQWSMRSEEFPRVKQSGHERVLVFGDSVVWGGAQNGQAKIATEIIRRSLNQASKAPVEVGNVAAPSWGPGNWLAYAKRYGFFNADRIVLVLSSHDAFDNPKFGPLTKEQPTSNPPSAIWEGIERYALPALHIQQKQVGMTDSEPTSITDPSVQKGLHDLHDFLSMAKASGAKVSAVQFWAREETRTGKLEPGNKWNRTILTELQIPTVQSGPIFRRCGSIEKLYTDGIHPYSASGQACLAQAIEAALQKPIHPDTHR